MSKLDISNEGKIELKKNLKLIDCISIIVGIIIGSGIFISPKGVIEQTGSIGSALLVWFSCGIFSMFGAMAYAELGCMIPKAGGEYEYLMVSFNKLCGFLFIWTFITIIIPASFALTALTFADYVLKPFYLDCDAPLSARLLIAASALMIITMINCISVKLTNLVQNLFTLGKVLGLLMIIALGIYSLYLGQVENFKTPFENTETNPGQFALAFYAGMYSFSGWSFLNYVVEEIKNPNKILPLSIFIGLSVVIVIYVFANIAYFTLLTPREMMASSAVAFSFAEKMMGSHSWIISAFVALSSLGYINGALFSASRTIFGAARNSHMPTVLALINVKFLTPMTSIIFMSGVSMVCLFIEDTFVLLKFTMLSEYIFIGGTVAGLLWMRKTQPMRERPIKVNLIFPVIFLLMCLFSIIMTLIITPMDSIICILVIFAGIPIYYLFVKVEKPKAVQDKLDAFTKSIQILTFSAFDESKLD